MASATVRLYVSGSVTLSAAVTLVECVVWVGTSAKD